MDAHDEIPRTRTRASLLALLAGCGGSDEFTAGAEANAAGDFEQINMNWRDRRVSRLTEPYGWLSLTGLHMLAPGETTVGSAFAIRSACTNPMLPSP